MSGIILDVIIVVVAVLLLIFGIWRGMYKLIFGLVSSLLAIALTIILVGTVTGFLVEKTTLDERLTTALSSPINKAFPNGDVMISLYDIDGDGTAAELGYTAEDGAVHPLNDLFAGTNYSLFGGVLSKVIAGQVSEGTEISFVNALSATVVGYIITAAVFIILLIVFAILVKLLMLLIKKFVTRTYLGHFINKFVGAILGLVIAAVIIWGFLAVVRLLSTYEWIIPVNNLIETSTLTKILYQHNYLYDFLVDRINIKGIIDSIIAKAGSMSGGSSSSDTPAAVMTGLLPVRFF